MRKRFSVSGSLWAVALCMSIAAGCGRSHSGLCQDFVGVDCPPAEPQCDGICVPYMDASWDMTLVGMNAEGDPPLHCPASAPNAAIIGKELPAPGGLPRRVLACSANPTPTCDSPTAVCMPVELNFMPCIVRDGNHDCTSTYATETTVVDQNGNTITVCCEGEPKFT